MKPLDLLAQFSRGEPISLAAVLIAVFGEFGMQLAPGDADSLAASVGRMLTILVGLYLARRHTTPFANPAIPVRDGTGARDAAPFREGGAAAPNTDLKPVITLSGRRA